MNDRLIVIGSNSFSGSHFIKTALDNGMNIVGISRSEELPAIFLPYKRTNRQRGEFSFLKLDINNDLDDILRLIYDFRPDYIVNFAAQGMVAESWNTPEQWFMTNTVSAVRLHNKLKDCKFLKKFVQISTPEVYGSCNNNLKENTIYNPSTPYAVSKAAADMSLMTFFRQYKFPVVFTRSANVYGPGQQLYRIIPKTILFFLTGKTLELHGGGRSVRSFIHINDVAQGTLNVMLYGKPGNIFHFSTDTPVSIRSIVKLIAKKTNTSFKDQVVDINDRLGKDNAYLLDCSKAMHELGWKAAISLEHGIDNTIVWVKNNIDILKKLPHEYIHKA